MNSELFSIFIPTWNNLPYLKLCIDSILKNSSYKHQIIIHVNEGIDGTLDWVKQQNLTYTFSKTNIGICRAMNIMRSKTTTNYICYLNDDMYVLPDWDKYLWEIIKQQSDNKFFVSSTMIQPHSLLQNQSIQADYGDNLNNFREQDLLKEFQKYEIKDWFGATWPPNVVHRDIWDEVGGYSIEFSPGMYSDPDFSAKLWMCGVRKFIGISKSRVYHFETKSTKRIIKNDGNSQFLFKWGIKQSIFSKEILKRGEVFNQKNIGIINEHKIKKSLFSTKIKAIWLAIKSKFCILINWYK
ncbi:MAG: glycosyltransferase [Bacteroidales bacterium]|nr:glycosyltransferase [Bacteroidales bacterium]